MADKSTLVSWLNDAYAMEKSLIPILKNHAKDVEDHPSMHQRILEHAEETRRQAERVEKCLERLGTTPSTTKSLIGSLFGGLKAPSTGMYKDERVKIVLADFASENFEIACYEAIIRAAEDAGELEIAAICAEILDEEREMAAWVHDQLPAVVDEYVLHSSTR